MNEALKKAEEVDVAETVETLALMEKELKLPWVNQANRHRRYAPRR